MKSWQVEAGEVFRLLATLVCGEDMLITTVGTSTVFFFLFLWFFYILIMERVLYAPSLGNFEYGEGLICTKSKYEFND